MDLRAKRFDVAVTEIVAKYDNEIWPWGIVGATVRRGDQQQEQDENTKDSFARRGNSHSRNIAAKVAGIKAVRKNARP